MLKRLYKLFIIVLIVVMICLIVPKIDYATENSIKIGDINGDGVIDSRDKLRILEHIASSRTEKIKQKHPDWILKDEQFKAGDINEDGVIDSRDKLRVLEYIAASRVQKIAQKHPDWKKNIENKWKSIEVTKITLDRTSITLEEGKSTKLIATIYPTDVTNKIVRWSSSNEKIAIVDGIGNVTGKTEGVAIITAKATNGAYKTCKVEVTKKDIQPTPTPATPAPVTPSTIMPTPATPSTIMPTPAKTTPTKTIPTKTTSTTTTKNINNVTITLNSKTFEYNGNVQTPIVTLKDGNTALAKGKDYVVSYTNNKSVGTATITITGKGIYTGKITKNFKINAKNISKLSITGIQNKSYTGKAITQNIVIKNGNITLKNGTDYTIKYQDNTRIGNNAKAIITGKGNYTGTITKKFSIFAIKATKLTTSQKIWRQLEKGKTTQLSVTVTPSNATYKTITWSSDNTKVATISQTGKVYVAGLGTAKITATQKESGKKLTFTIIGYIPPKSISFNKNTTTINKGSSEKLTLIFNPTNTSSKEVTWKSSNSNIVSVSNEKTTNGAVTITAKAKGTATITATHKYGLTAICKVSVIERIYPENETIKVGGKTITKGQYANFRNVYAGNLAPNILYRCINPILPYSSNEKEKAYYADRLLEAHNVNIVLSLSDSIGNMKSNGYSKATYYKRLLNAGKVYVYKFKDNGTYGTSSVKKTIVKGLRVFVNNKGPYVVHCKWGQGRTGFVIMLLECLMDSPYEYMYNDFVASFYNLNNSGANKEFSKTIKIITGKSAANKNHPKASDWKNVNFVKCAENYLKDGGMSDNEIQTLKNHLAGRY